MFNIFQLKHIKQQITNYTIKIVDYLITKIRANTH